MISVEAEKVFDRVKWDYLFTVLHKFGLGKVFISWIWLLYTSPQASISTSGIQSTYFTLSCSTRQGCPLSSLLFAWAIEPLSIYSTSTGISQMGLDFKLSLYANALLLYVSAPNRSISEILYIFFGVSAHSVYKVNISKCECYPINAPALEL